MDEKDPLTTLLREWEAPEPHPSLDARVRAACRAACAPAAVPPLWLRIWHMRVTIPVPVLAVALLIVAALWLQFRPRATAPAAPTVRPAPVASPGYMTRIENTGFQPLRDGATRIIRAKEVKQ